jgi:hypothetical protein
MRTVGVARCAIISPWRVSRADVRLGKPRPARGALRRQAPEPRTSTSSPASVAVTWMSSGFFIAPSASASAQAAAMAPPSVPASTGQRSIEMM